MYYYETHVHSKEGSACGQSSAREMVQAYKKAGYAGFVLTNHFIGGNTSVPRDLDWETRMKMYYQAYLDAKEEGDKLDFDVLFGIEEGYGKGKEVLIYGIDLEFLLAHPDWKSTSIDVYAKWVHEAGGLVVHAHPNRVRDYIISGVKPRYDLCDGIEIYNSYDSVETNAMSTQDAKDFNKIVISGGDVHSDHDSHIGLAGMRFEKRIKTNEELVAELKSRNGCLLIDGREKR